MAVKFADTMVITDNIVDTYLDNGRRRDRVPTSTREVRA